VLSHSFYPLTITGAKTMPSPRQKGKVEKVMHEYKEGKLNSGSAAK
jgi:hypothetical protein